jgi:drug/metabolite transporter (DMT)-like permease
MTSTIITLVYMVLLPFAYFFLKVDTRLNATGLIASILGGLCMCAGSLGYFYALRSGGAGITTILTSLYPVLTLILSVAFLHESISLKQGLGMCFALISFLLMATK